MKRSYKTVRAGERTTGVINNKSTLDCFMYWSIYVEVFLALSALCISINELFYLSNGNRYYKKIIDTFGAVIILFIVAIPQSSPIIRKQVMINTSLLRILNYYHTN